MKNNPSSSDLASLSETIRAIEKISDAQNENEAILALSNILENEVDLIARSLAAETLAKYKKNDSVAKVLSEILMDQSKGSLVRCAAARALGKIGGDRARDALIKSIDNDSQYPLVMANAIKSLGKMRDPKVIPSVIELFSSMDDPRCPPYLIRTYAAETLGQIGSFEGVAILKKAYEGDSHSSVREAAEKALLEIANRNDIPTIQDLLNSIKNS